MLTRIDAAKELLARRKARNGYADFCRYICPSEPPHEHHLLICDALDKIISGDLTRLMIFMPPGSAKSTYATVRFPVHYLSQKQSNNIICASYNDTTATQFGRKTRNLFRSEEYQALYPEISLSSDSQSKGEWETNLGGTYFSVGIGGGVTGRRADLGIIDDPVRGQKDADSELVRNNIWDWYISDFRTRLKPGASIVIIMTRWHQDDLAGRILPNSWDGESGEIKSQDGEKWQVLCLPAQASDGDILGRSPGDWLWPEWFSGDFWEQTKTTVTQAGYRQWNSLYMQKPSDIEGAFFRREWFKRFHLGQQPETCNYQSSDFATRDGHGDFTEFGVFGVAANNDVYVLDWWYGQETTNVWIDAQLEQYDNLECFAAFGETGQIRRAVEPFQEMRANQRGIYPRFEWIVRSGDKASIARSFQGMASIGKIHIPHTDWGDRLINQLCSFPSGKYDDAVDVCALMGLAINESHPAIVETTQEITKINDGYYWPEDEEESWKTA